MDEGIAPDLGGQVAIIGILEPARSIHVFIAKAPLTTAAVRRIQSLVASIPGSNVVHTPDARIGSGPLVALLQPPKVTGSPEVPSTGWARDESPYHLDAPQVAAAIGLAAPIADAAPESATTARFLVAQTVISNLLALSATLAILVLGRTTRNGIRNHLADLAGFSIAGLGTALAASASIHAITLTRGSLVEAWTLTMIALAVLGALLLLFLEQARPVHEADGATDDSAATSFVLRCGMFLCWLAAGSSLSPLIAIASDFPTMRWLAGGSLLAAGLLCTIGQREDSSKARATLRTR